MHIVTSSEQHLNPVHRSTHHTSTNLPKCTWSRSALLQTLAIGTFTTYSSIILQNYVCSAVKIRYEYNVSIIIFLFSVWDGLVILGHGVVEKYKLNTHSKTVHFWQIWVFWQFRSGISILNTLAASGDGL